MKLTRRSFLKLTIASFSAVGLFGEGYATEVLAEAPEVPQIRTKGGKEFPTVCCYCSVGCGAICTVEDDELINLDGDPDHPINEGTLCAKGAAMFNIRNIYGEISESTSDINKISDNPFRITKPLYRAKGAKDWEEKTWDWAYKEIAKRVKETRDKYFIEKDGDVTVNRNEAIAFLGGAAHDNEECHLIQKMARALGVVFIEHQARI